MHQDLIHAKTGLPLDFEWVGGAEQRLKPTARCCQTNDCKHRIASTAYIYALNNQRHSARAAARFV